MMKWLLFLSLLLGVAFVATQELFYEPFIVPRLTTWQQIPTLWWIAAFAPEFGVCAAAALLARHTKEWLAFCAIGALVVSSLQWLAGLLNEPGHHKVIEGGIGHFILQFLVLALLLFACVASIRFIRFGVRACAASAVARMKQSGIRGQ